MTALTLDRENVLLAAMRGNAAAREAAFTELCKSLQAQLSALCLHLCKNRSDAEDALQDSLLGLYRALPAFRGEARVATLAYRIALRSAFQVRAKRPQAPAPLEEAAKIASDTTPSDDQAAARQTAMRMLAAMEKLPADDRAVLALFAIEGLAHKEIAEILALPEGTVWYRLHRARKKLRELAG